MGKRRVSFAPEATLHTWNVVEIAEDSTTSSASTNSTRRQSSMTNSTMAQSPLLNVQSSPARESDPAGPPSTPPEQVEEPVVKASPAHQRDLHQKKRRRKSSAVPPMNFNNPDDETEAFSSSPYSGSSVAEGDDTPIALVDDVGTSSSSDESDTEGDTTMNNDNVTGQSVGSSSSTSSSSRLDEALRQAATEAGTQGIDYDENGGDLSMEMATGVTHAFQPWANKNKPDGQNLSSMQDQENINPFSPAFKASIGSHGQPSPKKQQTEADEEMSMDVTKAIGGILSRASPKSSPEKNRRKSVVPPRRRSSVGRRRSSGDASTLDDETMEFTTVGGGILQQSKPTPQTDEDESAIDEDEEMTMDFTNVVGGISTPQQRRGPRRSSAAHNENIDPRILAEAPPETLDESVSMDETMDMTSAFGGILAPIEEQTEPQTQQSVNMDITTAMGGILAPQLNTGSKTRAKELMEQEADAADGQLNNSPLQERDISTTTPKSAVPNHLATVASETGSPSLAVLKAKPSGRRSIGSRMSTTPKAASRQSTPIKKPSTPLKQLTPLAVPPRPTTPGKTPPMNNVTFRSASPKKLFKAELKAKNSPASQKKIFSHNVTTGEMTPSVVLKPRDHLRRRSSGVGIDKEGLGSPQVAALLDRRRSIGEDAPAFVPQAQGGVRFEDPKAMEEELDAEREEDERRESGRFILEQEVDQPMQQADEENATVTLKEMIESLTPKKNKLKGRKSLHVGAAKGLLGKRPAELDEDDEEESTPKRLKVTGQSSPVKSIRLPAPPSQEETTGRSSKGLRKTLAELAQNSTPTTRSSPLKVATAETPKAQGRFKDANAAAYENEARPTSFEEKLDNVIDAVDPHIEEGQAEEDERIHLQDFLNMTNIHFMELNTTKRRHTVVPSSAKKPTSQDQVIEPPTLESCVVAGVCTVPMLELYQHSCRELKSYISEGRRIIRSIEAETYDEQPPLFKEYLSAPPDLRLLMDNQFRNVKTHARLLSKGMWYEWRMKLLEGLREGLASHVNDMNADDEVLTQHEEILENAVPSLIQKHGQLGAEAQHLQQQALEDESEDKEALTEAREQLSSVDEALASKRDMLLQLQTEMQEKEDTIAAAAELKTEFEGQIQEAERLREQCRGWSVEDVRSLQKKVEKIEESSGWKIISATEDDGDANGMGPALTMKYKDEIRLFFYPAAFARDETSDAANNAPISLVFSPPPSDDDVSSTEELKTEKRFVLQLLQSHLHALVQSTTPVKTMIASVAQGWDVATSLANEIRLLILAGITNVNILSDDTVRAKTMLLLPALKARFDVEFTLTAAIVDARIATKVDVKLEKVYGGNELDGRKAKMVRDALLKEVHSKGMGQGGWVAAARGLEEWVVGQAQGVGARERTPRRK